MVQVLNENTDFNAGVVIIKPTERGDYRPLKLQGGLFTVILDGVKNGKLISEKKLVDCVRQVVNPFSQWNDYLALAEDPDIRFIISNTTEAGIRFDSENLFEGNPPIEFPGKLTMWLYHRFRYFKGSPFRGCLLLPCELTENNGMALKECVLKYIDLWNLGDDFTEWIHTANLFCNTLVDRIVSGYPSEHTETIQNQLGHTDKLLVTGEYYHS